LNETYQFCVLKGQKEKFCWRGRGYLGSRERCEYFERYGCSLSAL